MRTLAVAVFFLPPLPAMADPPVVEKVTVRHAEDGWRFDVTISHPDSGWEHYADAWRILDMDGNQLGIRELAHPHENEQPFTRSLSRVKIPAGTQAVQIEARCLVDGWSGTLTRVDLN